MFTTAQATAGLGLGLAVSAGFDNSQAAQALVTPIAIILLLYGGFYIKVRGQNDMQFSVSCVQVPILQVESVPPGTEWIAWLSFIRWAFQTLVINEFHDRNLNAFPGYEGNDVIRQWGYDK